VSDRPDRRCERVNDRLDIAASAYLWAAGVAAYPWTRGLPRAERRAIEERVRALARAANGHGAIVVRDARDEAALAVLHALPLDGDEKLELTLKTEAAR
jgi:hypothetical protein